jgi:hypothetical protein
MATGFLRVEGTQVVDEAGHPIILRGAGLGGWMKSALPPSTNHV